MCLPLLATIAEGAPVAMSLAKQVSLTKQEACL
jgi:hypothetical protein